MKFNKAGYPLLTLLFFCSAASAATLKEMMRLDALELRGAVSVCEGEGTLQAGNARMKFGDRARGTVISGPGEPLRYHVERSNSVDGVVYARYEFEMTTRLESDTQVVEIDTNTIHVSFPENKAEAADMVNFIRAHKVERQDIHDIQITTFPRYEINPAPDDIMNTRYHCGPESHAG